MEKTLIEEYLRDLRDMQLLARAKALRAEPKNAKGDDELETIESFDEPKQVLKWPIAIKRAYEELALVRKMVEEFTNSPPQDPVS